MDYAQRNPNPLFCFQGEDKNFILSLKKKDGTVYNLTNCTVASEIRSSTGALITNLNAQIIDTAQGKIKLTILSGVTAGHHYYDVRITAPTGIDFIDPSTFTVLPTVTKI